MFVCKETQNLPLVLLSFFPFAGYFMDAQVKVNEIISPLKPRDNSASLPRSKKKGLVNIDKVVAIQLRSNLLEFEFQETHTKVLMIE